MESNKNAMKRILGITIIIYVTCVMISCKRYKRPFTADLTTASVEVKEGEVLYMKYCQTCHPDGEAGLGPSVYYLPSFSKRFQVRHGIGVMPKFKENVISDDDLDKIVAYLKALKKN